MSTETDDTTDSLNFDLGEEDVTPVGIDHRPTRASSIAAVVAALLAALTSAPFALLALPTGFGGVALIAHALFISDGNRTWVTFGTVGLVISILVGGGFGAPPEILLVSMLATMIAWNLGQTAIGLGEQIGRHSKTRRLEIIHGAVVTLVGIIAAGLGYAAFSFASGGQPIAALGTILIGLVFLVWALR